MCTNKISAVKDGKVQTTSEGDVAAFGKQYGAYTLCQRGIVGRLNAWLKRF
jgi:hypothetical protein